MQFLQRIRKFVHNFDLFYSSQLLRFEQDTQYKTLTGGIISMSIVVVIILGFMSMIAQTLQRTSIISSITTIKQADPPLIELTADPQNKFMIAISIQTKDVEFTVDIYNTSQYFNIEMNLLTLQYGIPSYRPLALQKCTRQHWKGFPQFVDNYDDFLVGRWACLPLNQSYPIQGMYTSPLNTQLQVNAYKCRNSTKNNNSCASNEQIDALFDRYGNFYFGFIYINSVINPNLKDHISYYIEGNDYAIISKDIGSESWVYFTDFQIESDNSIWPFTQTITQKGFIVEEKATNRPLKVYDDKAPLGSVFFAKSVNSIRYKRQVQKISAVFSYIGGLVGAVTATLFFVNIYTDSSLQITIGLNLFEEEQEQEEQKQKIGKNFNFFSFVALEAYRLLRFVGWSGDWKGPQKLETYQNEAVKQLDVQSLLKRMIKLQGCMTHLLTQTQLKQIRNGHPITVDNAKRMRSLLLKHQRRRQDKTSKVIIADNYTQKQENKQRKQGDSNIQSAQSIIRRQIVLDTDNTLKITEVDEGGKIDDCPNSQFLFCKHNDVAKEKRRIRHNDVANE